MKQIISFCILFITFLTSCNNKNADNKDIASNKNVVERDETNYFQPSKDTVIYASNRKADYDGDAYAGHLDVEPYRNGSVIKVGIKNHWVAFDGEYAKVTEKIFYVKEKLPPVMKMGENFTININGKECKFILTLF